jgi:hypothetical protein
MMGRLAYMTRRPTNCRPGFQLDVMGGMFGAIGLGALINAASLKAGSAKPAV